MYADTDISTLQYENQCLLMHALVEGEENKPEVVLESCQ